MENFIVSARKYRPASFEMVVGQDSITNTLRNAIKNNHLSQAYLFCGPRGVGKTTCARIFAKAINCTNPGENGEPCDKCESCNSFNSLRSFNIHELDAASNNKVEDIRSLNDQVRIPPQIGKYSIYIIDEVHMLSSSAFNAFLKTLEEPPAHAVFILATTEKHKIIPTILSRCQIFDFKRIKVDDIIQRLIFVAKNESVTVEEEALHVIALKADGAMRDALSIFDQVVSLCGKKVTYSEVIENLNVLDYEYYFRCVDAAIKGDVSDILLTFNEVLDKGFDGHNFIAGLSSHLRDLLVSRDPVTLSLLETTPAVRHKYVQQTSLCQPDFLLRALEVCSLCDINYKSSKNQRLHVEIALIKLIRFNNDQSPTEEKKKPEPLEKPLKLPDSPSLQQAPKPNQKPVKEQVVALHEGDPQHNPAVPKPLRSVSIKDLLGDNSPSGVSEGNNVAKNTDSTPKSILTTESLIGTWNEFVSGLDGDGPRIVSMFKSIVPELTEEGVINIHLNNAAQKDLFILNYKQQLFNFIERRHTTENLEIESTVDANEQNNLLYSDEQKYTHLVSKHPPLKDIKKAFNLDFN